MTRKTFSVSDLTDTVNSMLAKSAPELTDRRQGMMNVLEHVLHESGNYRGFRYLLKGQCEGAPGVNYVGNMPHPDIEERFANTDRTRVQYF